MKTIVKIEIAILILVLLVGAAMVLVSEGVLNLFFDPVIKEHTAEPVIAEEPAAETAEPDPTAAEETIRETEPQTTTVEGTDGQTEEGPRVITATRYFAYDVRDGEYLQKVGDGDEKLYPASITKLLSAYVVLSHMDPQETVVVGDALTLVQEGSSVADLQEGDTLTVEQLIAAMMLPSGNDAAQVAAVAAGRAIVGKDADCQTAMATFVAEMNEQAEAFGMKNSHFENPDGWHNENHYTTMNDLVTLSEKVLANQIILKYTSRVAETVKLPDRDLEWKNTNYLLYSEGEAYLPNTIGLKTGYTDAAGGCLITAFFEGDRLLLIGVFGCPAYTMDRYLDTVDIYNSL